jgi:hypothetical protein
MRRHNRQSIRPLLGFDCISNVGGVTGIRLRNNGLGPAIILVRMSGWMTPPSVVGRRPQLGQSASTFHTGPVSAHSGSAKPFRRDVQ